MAVFIECVCEGNLKGLCYEGNATEAQLKDTWVIILSQYYEAKGNVEDEQWKLNVDIQRMNNHLFLVEKCVAFLRFKYSESVASSLLKLGYTFRPREIVPEKYAKELNSVVQKSKTKYIQLKQMVARLESMLKTIKVELPKRADFEKVLIELEQMQGVPYNFDTMTVQKFLLLEKNYHRQVQILENRKQKK